MTPTSGTRRTTMMDHKPRRRGNAEPHVLTRGGAIVCGNHFSLPRPILTTGLMPRSDVRAPSRLPIPKLQFPDAGIWELGVG